MATFCSLRFRSKASATALACALALAGCKGSGEPAPKPESKLHRFAFKDVEGNRPKGSSLPGEDCDLLAPDGQTVKLSSMRGKPIVLVFNRGFVGFVCPYCTTYTAQLATRYEELKKLGAEVVLVYPVKEEDQAKREEFKAAVDEILREEGQAGLPFPVFLDSGLAAVTKFNLTGDLSKPSTFVLDATGKIHYAYVGEAPDERPTVQRIVEEVQRLQGAGK